MSEKNTPNVRFNGFNDPWEQRKLNQVVKIIAGGDIDKKKLRNQGTFPVIANSVTSNGIVGYYDNEYRINAPAVTVTGRGDVGHATARYTNFTPVIRLLAITSVLFNVKFLESAINEISLFSESTGVPQLTAPQLGNYKIKFASLNEQIKIGDLLTSIDSLIASNQRKVDQLKEVKKLLMQKIFGQEWRFKGFTDPWEQRKLKRVTTRVKSYALTRAVETASFTGFKYIHYGDIHTKVANKIDNPNVLPNIKSGNYESLNANDIVVADASEDYKGIADAAILLNDAHFVIVAGLHTIALRPLNCNSMFIYYLLKTDIFKRYGYKVGTGLKVFGITYDNLVKFEFNAPSIKEQKMISQLLMKLEKQIASNQEKVDQLTEMKKWCMQNMFV